MPAHGLPPDGFEAIQAVRESDGIVFSVDDEEALDGQLLFARREGMYVEPSSATVVVAMNRLLDHGHIGTHESAVALICGSGFRETFLSMNKRPMCARRLRLESLEQALNEVLER